MKNPFRRRWVIAAVEMSNGEPHPIPRIRFRRRQRGEEWIARHAVGTMALHPALQQSRFEVVKR